ncbi:MAG: alpha/beta fold hydrolase, partial [Ardenticatenaceae bacterium]
MSLPTAPVMPAGLEEELKRVESKYRTMARLMTTRYPIAQTPKEVVWTLNKARLYRYIPVLPPEQRRREPLFIVYALVNRPTILDLRPGNSFVEYMVKKGYDVYLIDWGAPGPEDKNLKMDDYVLDYMARSIRKIKSVSGSDTFNILGWCIGALLSTSYAALRPDDGLRNLILLTAPLDFSDKQVGGFVGWVNDYHFDVDKILARYGNMPGELVAYGAKALKPVDSYVTNYLRLWDNLDNP